MSPNLDGPLGRPSLEAQADRAALGSFLDHMTLKLAKKRSDGMSGWQDKAACSNEFLSERLRECVEKGDPVDVANFAMMIHQRGERIAARLAATPKDVRESDR